MNVNPKIKKGLCFALSYLVLVTGAYFIGKDHGKRENVTVRDAFDYINSIKEDLNNEILVALHERYNILKAQGIAEDEKVYSIGTLSVADIKADSYHTFDDHPAYSYQYWIIENDDLFGNCYEPPYKSIFRFYDAVFPNYSEACITGNPARDDSGSVTVADNNWQWLWYEGEPFKGVLPLAYYLTDEEIEKGYITESELENVFIRINTEELQTTLQRKN